MIHQRTRNSSNATKIGEAYLVDAVKPTSCLGGIGKLPSSLARKSESGRDFRKNFRFPCKRRFLWSERNSRGRLGNTPDRHRKRKVTSSRWSGNRYGTDSDPCSSWIEWKMKPRNDWKVQYSFPMSYSWRLNTDYFSVLLRCWRRIGYQLEKRLVVVTRYLLSRYRWLKCETMYFNHGVSKFLVLLYSFEEKTANFVA